MAKMSALARAQLTAARYKKENSELAKEARKERRELKAELQQALVVGGLSATGGAIAGSKLQNYLNENYGPDSKLRALTNEIPTLTVIGAIAAVAGVGFSKDNTTRAIIAGAMGGLAGGAYVEGTGLQ